MPRIERLLRSYRDRGLRVSGMHTQVLALTVRGADRPAVGRRAVTDVLADAVAGDRAHDRWALPHDRPSTRRVVLVRGHGSVAGRRGLRRGLSQDRLHGLGEHVVDVLVAELEARLVEHARGPR